MTEPTSALPFEIGDPASVLAVVIEHCGACVKLMDLDGHVIVWNRGCERLYGWRADEVLGKVLPHVPPQRRASALDFVRSVAASGVVTEQAVVAVNADGWRQNFLLTAFPVADTDGDVAAVLTIARDALSPDRGEIVGDEVSAFMARMFGEPLGAMANAASLLSRPEVAKDPERRAPLIARIAERSQEARGLLDDLRVAAGDTDGIVVHERERTDIGSLVAEVAARLGPDGQRVLVDFAVGTACADVDRTRMARALEVMLRGAVAGVRDGTRVHASARKAGSAVAVEIRYRGTVFGAALSDEAVGTGLTGHGGAAAGAWSGLRYVDAVARAHGGRVTTSANTTGDVAVILALPSGGTGFWKGAISSGRA